MLLPHELAFVMIGNCASRGIIGIHIPKFCLGLSIGIIVAFIKKAKVLSSDTGLIGPMAWGSGKGIIGLKTDTIYQIALASIIAKFLLGIKMPDLVWAISLSLVMYFTFRTDFISIHYGVALGSGIGILLNLFPKDFSMKVMEEMARFGFDGSKLQDVIESVTLAFALYFLLAARIPLTIVGVPTIFPPGTPLPGTGIGIGQPF